MAWNRIHAARLLDEKERALLEASLPEHASQLSDSELRGRLQRLRSQRERCQASAGCDQKARMLEEALLRLEKEQARRERPTEEKQAAPRSGRTGGLGTRAERPSEGGSGRTAVQPVEAGRSSKAPSEFSERRRRQADG